MVARLLLLLVMRARRATDGISLMDGASSETLVGFNQSEARTRADQPMRGRAPAITKIGHWRALHKQDGGNNLSKPRLRTRRVMQQIYIAPLR